ncbi:MAG: acyl CoA:acetate/3-ketoacid CoA transferase [Pelotomaculum sp.]|uniref:Acyl CoA:acetate/3-ketoacid CoA transferase n=1 Tax=Pelotomaculum thermopropionicum (strain DSM 13744 / JCM 10971 / SI) TaxID=370438 RepID=A5D225_PELTS|nr:acyl CoA:acetate/3-ketoacid CoA transferase [Pelotomaculum sp.]BAF59722.1 acyl CoA:acetate/3-ketoacid CoA transferase [Pelotomaculum thermopropionicum SI]
MSKIITAEQAAELIQDGMCIAWTTAGLCGFAEEVASAIEKRFLETGHPRDLMLTHSCGCGDHKNRGMNHFGHEGMVRKHIGGHIGEAPKLGKLVLENKIECHLIPQGVMTHLWRQIAGKKIGVITKVGLGTYVDPRLEGGKANDITKDDMVKLIEFEGEEYLYYKPFKIDVAVIRGTTCDENGNFTMDKECLFLEALQLAMAVKNNGGMVIAQVQYISKPGTLHPKSVKVPGALIDYIVVAKPENHLQTKITYLNPALCGDIRTPLGSIPPLPLNERKIIGRRAAMELRPGAVVNMGIGMPDGVASVAGEEGVAELLTLTTELGNFGGMPAKGDDFPATWNSECTIEHPSMFDFYDGGGLDICFLGSAQTDKEGNINVSKFGNRVVGPGGFVNISSTAKKVVFVGTLTAGAEYEVKDGTIHIVKEGNIKKFVQKVDQVTFSGKYAQKNGQKVVYVTERAVFTLEDGEVTLIEVAPGLDLEKDVLAAMDFKPRISPGLKEMPREIFQPEWGQLKKIMLEKA